MKYVLFPLGFFSLNISHLWPTAAGEWDEYIAVVDHGLSEVYAVGLYIAASSVRQALIPFSRIRHIMK